MGTLHGVPHFSPLLREVGSDALAGCPPRACAERSRRAMFAGRKHASDFVEERAFRACPNRSRRARVNDLYQSRALALVDTRPKGHLLAGLRRVAKAPLFHGTAIRPNKTTLSSRARQEAS